MFAVRYILPAVLVVAGLVFLLVAPESTRLEAWAGFTGAGLSILLLNVLYRMGVTGDHERDTEQKQRDYFDKHGRWPDEAPAVTFSDGAAPGSLPARRRRAP